MAREIHENRGFSEVLASVANSEANRVFSFVNMVYKINSLDLKHAPPGFFPRLDVFTSNFPSEG